jgi:hypothetical protein
MAEKLEAENAGWERTAKDLVAGAAGGIAQVLLGELAAITIMPTFLSIQSSFASS